MKAASRKHYPFARQSGAALVVALVLLLIVTVLGIAGIRSSTLQERMSGNMYDRSIAFQRAEGALRAAEDAITANWRIEVLGGEDCSHPPPAAACPLVPDNTFTGTSVEWINVAAAHEVNGDLAPGTPQYYIQFMGTGPSEDNNLDLDANADYGNYGNPYPPDTVAYYRVTARSSAPADANAAGRSIVVLQSTVKRAF